MNPHSKWNLSADQPTAVDKLLFVLTLAGYGVIVGAGMALGITLMGVILELLKR